MMLAQVADGRLDGYADGRTSVWDVIAGLVLVREAGGTFTDLAGGAGPAGGSAVATNGLLHDEVLSALR